jgi:hypothetical protein
VRYVHGIVLIQVREQVLSKSLRGLAKFASILNSLLRDFFSQHFFLNRRLIVAKVAKAVISCRILNV